MDVYLIMFVQQLIASSTHLVVKNITTAFPAPLIVFLRGAFASLGFAIFVLLRKNFLPKFEKKDFPKLLLLGLTNIPINQFLFMQGLQYSTPPNAALAYALTPTFVLVITAIFYKEKITRRKFLGVVLAFAGTAVVLIDRGVSADPNYVLGNFMVLGASMSWAWYTVLGRGLAKKYGAMYSTALSMFTGFLLFAIEFFFLPVKFDVHLFQPVHWVQLFYLGVVTSGIGYALWAWALTKTDASKVAVFNNMQPLLTTILAIIFLSQMPTVYFVAGGVIAIAGVILTQRG